MKKQHWDEIFDALWDGARRASDGLATLNRKQKLELDNFARRVKDKDVDLASRTSSHTMVDDPGALADDAFDNVAKTFAGGRYDVEVTTEDVVLFRGGDSQRSLGQFFSESPPMGEIQVRMDYAVERYWLDGDGNYTGTSIVDTGYAVLIPSGTTIYRGPVGSRGDGLPGGAEQIFIPKPWSMDGVEALAGWGLP